MISGLNLNKFRQETLRRHNMYRRRHRAPNLVLSSKINAFAQRYANYLARIDRMRHSKGSGYGENLYVKWGTGNFKISAKDAVDMWYREISKYRFGRGGFSPATGHFTQLVWNSSRKLGVGLARSRTGKYYVVANYSPPGNVRGRYAINVLPPK